MWNDLVSPLLSQEGDFVLKTCQCLMTYSHMEIGSEQEFLISAAKSAVFYALLLLHLLPMLSAMWKVHPLPGSNGKNERKEGSASSGPSDRCGHPVSVGWLSFPPLLLKWTLQFYREEVKLALQCHFWGYLYTHSPQGLGVAMSMKFINWTLMRLAEHFPPISYFHRKEVQVPGFLCRMTGRVGMTQWHVSWWSETVRVGWGSGEGL